MAEENPYPTISKNKEVVQFVLKGGRMEKPAGCPESIYRLMLQMWTEDPKQRPDFATILKELLALNEAEEVVDSKSYQSGVYDLTFEDPKANYQENIL